MFEKSINYQVYDPVKELVRITLGDRLGCVYEISFLFPVHNPRFCSFADEERQRGGSPYNQNIRRCQRRQAEQISRPWDKLGRLFNLKRTKDRSVRYLLGGGFSRF